LNIRITKKKILWNYIGVAVSLGSNIVLLPIIIYFIDSELLGLWYVFLSIGGIVNLFDFGFNPTLARNIAYCWSGAKELSKKDVIYTNNCEPNMLLLKKVIITCQWIYFSIATLAFLVITLAGTNYIKYIAKDIPSTEYFFPWIVYCLAIFLNLYYGYFATFLRGIGAISELNKANILSKSIQILISIILLSFGYRLLAVSLAYLINGIVLRIISKKAFYKYENIGYRLKKINRKIDVKDIKTLFQIVWYNAWRDGIVSLSTYLSGQATTIICSLYLTLSDTGVYSISLQIVNAIVYISGASYTVYQPSLQSAYIVNNSKELKKIMSTAMTTFYLLYIIGITLVLTIGIPILECLKPGSSFNRTIIFFIAVYLFLLQRYNFYASYISNTNNVPYMKTALITSTSGIILSIISINLFHIGIWGLILPQIFVQISFNTWYWPNKVKKSLDIHWNDMLRIGMKNITLNLKNLK